MTTYPPPSKATIAELFAEADELAAWLSDHNNHTNRHLRIRNIAYLTGCREEINRRGYAWPAPF